jgi:DNA-binding XRE family transcriptional regulator
VSAPVVALAPIAPRSGDPGRGASAGEAPPDRSSVGQGIGRPPVSSIGERLRHLRTSRRLTQRQLAERACISLEAVWTIENGRKHPRRSTASQLARALGVGTSELLWV